MMMKLLQLGGENALQKGKTRQVQELGFDIKVGWVSENWASLEVSSLSSFWWNWRWCNWPADVIASHLVSLRLLFQKHLTLTPALIRQNTLVTKLLSTKLKTRVREMKIDWGCFCLSPGRKEGWWVAYGEVNSQKHLCIQNAHNLRTHRLNMSTYQMTTKHERTPGWNQMIILVC